MRVVRGMAHIRREIVEVCRRLYERGLVAGQDGNVSVRMAGNRVLVTPAGMSKVDVRAADLVELTIRGGHAASSKGGREASSEVQLHLAAYAMRPDVRAVVHAHPPIATGFSVAGKGVEHPMLSELKYGTGTVPLVPYAPPGSRELADRAAQFLRTHDVVLLEHHGAVAVGPELFAAHQRMESLE
ncbi:MAG: class II aldolase/adducin family protein, partial [Gemmatimonadales bacterium]